jgi:hypothetical protein
VRVAIGAAGSAAANSRGSPRSRSSPSTRTSRRRPCAKRESGITFATAPGERASRSKTKQSSLDALPPVIETNSASMLPAPRSSAASAAATSGPGSYATTSARERRTVHRKATGPGLRVQGSNVSLAQDASAGR